MKRRSRIELTLIADEATRRQTFKKRKRGVLKKLNELVTLCDIKACAVIYSPYQSNPEVWPSKEVVEEMVSRFVALPKTERAKRMLNQEAYLWERITRGEEQVKRLRDENRESQLRKFMFDCLKGKMMVEYSYDASDIQELSVFAGQYLNKINRRIEILTGNNHPSSVPLHPPPPPIVADATLPRVVPIRYYEQLHHRMIHGMNMCVNANLSEDQSLNMTLNSNQYPNHPLSFTELLTGIPTTNISTTDHMSFFNTVDGFVPNITNNLVTTGHMSCFTTVDVNDFTPYINNDLSTISHMPSINITNANAFAPYINNDLSTIGHMPSITTADADVFTPYMSNNLYGQEGYFE